MLREPLSDLGVPDIHEEQAHSVDKAQEKLSAKAYVHQFFGEWPVPEWNLVFLNVVRIYRWHERPRIRSLQEAIFGPSNIGSVVEILKISNLFGR